MTWDLESFKKDEMIFQLYFTNAEEISTDEDKDYLAITIKDGYDIQLVSEDGT